MNKALLGHFEEMRARLSELERLLDQDDRAKQCFREFLDHNEFGLAFFTICDSLLECSGFSLTHEDWEALGKLNDAMQISDNRLAELKKRVK